MQANTFLKQAALVFLLFFQVFFLEAQEITAPWPEITVVSKPWTRWWWMGNAVDKQNIKKSLIAFNKAGLGGVEITPIYGVMGEEDRFVNYLSSEWMELLNFTIKTADSLEMKVDMTLGTGWPYGGSYVTTDHAATKLVIEKQKLKKGEKINKIIRVENIKDRKYAKLNSVLAFGSDGSYYDLTAKIKDSTLKWKAKKSDYILYNVFTGKTQQQVKRAAPGSKGFTLDHYSNAAFNFYVKPFDAAFKSLEKKPRIIFNDSYEVYGTDFTPNFFNAFKELRGYDLKPYLNVLADKKDNETANRIRSDYRQTLSELLLTKFNRPWTKWVNEQGSNTRLQAHGSPGNLIDLYASADIPECETFGSMPYDIPGLRREKEDIREGDADAVMLKFSSSAAHISGKPLTSSETFTWLRDHFKTALSQCKPEAEDLLLNGVNHIFLHGSTYSPERAIWPGWKFYASVNFNQNNSIWEDADSLFSYIANCQSMLQTGTSDNETLLYWPIYDVWDDYLKGELFFQFKIHSLKEWLHGRNFYATVKKLMNKGYGVDFVSDEFIEKAKVEGGKIVLPGGSYKSLVVPDSHKMPLATLQKLIDLKKEGAVIIFEGLPESVPGFYQFKERNTILSALISDNAALSAPVSNVVEALQESDIHAESLVASGLKFIRRDIDGEKMYYLVNHTPNPISTFIPLQIKTEEVVIFDPLTKNYGKAQIEKNGSITKVKIDIQSGQSIFLKTGKRSNVESWNYYSSVGAAIEIKGDWKITFLKGAPNLPKSETVSDLKSWTTLGQDAEHFSGTAIYEIEFELPSVDAENYILNLGDVRESAKVWLNDRYLGTAWSVPFKLNTGKLQQNNILRIQVTNLAANRIRAKENRGEEWKIFHEINMVNKDYKKFDATLWKPMPSGLLSKVTLAPLELLNNH